MQTAGPESIVRVSGGTFEDSTIVIDGYDYKNCVFNRCTLVFRGTQPVGMAHCSFNGCTWAFDGPAQNTLGFLASLYHGMGPEGAQMVEATFDNIRNFRRSEEDVDE